MKRISPAGNQPKRPRPSYRWNGEHGHKIVHRYWLGAWWHAFRLNHLAQPHRRKPGRRLPYPCRWTCDYHEGEIAPVHWHVGRPKKEACHG